MRRFLPGWSPRRAVLAAILILSGCLGTDCFGSGNGVLDVVAAGYPDDPSVRVKVFIEEGVGRQGIQETHVGGTVTFKNLAEGIYGVGVVTEPPGNCTAGYETERVDEGEHERVVLGLECVAGELEVVVSGLPTEVPIAADVALSGPVYVDDARVGNGSTVMPIVPGQWLMLPFADDDPAIVEFLGPITVGATVPVFGRATVQVPFAPELPYGETFAIAPDPVLLVSGQVADLEAAVGALRVPDATWSVDDPAIAGLTPGSPSWLARVAALTPGTTTVRVRAHGLTAAATVTVVAPPTPNQLPVVAITSPADGSNFADGTQIAFQGTATDPEDGPLSGTALQWSSSLDGALGTGATVTSVLSEGQHTITLQATDGDGASALASIGVTVDPPAPPFTLAISPTLVDALSFGYGTATVTIARAAGFTGVVSLRSSVSTKGIAGTFNPADAPGGTSAVSFDVAGFVPAGTYRLFVTGVASGWSRSIPVDVRVTPYTPSDAAGFLLSVETPMSVVPGATSAPAAVVVARAPDLTMPIALSIAGLPAGVTAAFGENPLAGGTTTVTFTATSAAVPGTYQVTVTGQVPGLTRTATLTLIVAGGAAP